LIRLLAFIALVFAFASPAAAQSTVALRPWARIAPGEPVRIADVADLQGPEAEALASIVLVTPEELARSPRVELAQVRAAAEKQARVNLGRISFSGGVCNVRTVTPPSASAASGPSAAPQTQPAPAGDTVRRHVAARIAQTLGVGESDLRLTFEDGADLLALPTSGRTVAVQPAAISERMPVNVRVYRGDRIEAEGTIRVGVLVRRDVLIAREAVSRGGVVDMAHVDVQEQWLPPAITPARRDQVIGAVARTRIEPGRVLLARDVEAPIVVSRGDLVAVDCLSGTVIVSTTARAKESGREGDVIQFQSLTSKKTFAARVSGPGRAVLLADDAKVGS
jgi:flagella basal body P-ring formation protein FlgA